MTSSHVNTLEVTYMKTCIWACGLTLRKHARNDDISGETEGREHYREVQESEIEVVWTREEMSPTIRRKKYSGVGTTMEKKKNRKTEPGMDGQCQPIHESYHDMQTMKSMA